MIKKKEALKLLVFISLGKAIEITFPKYFLIKVILYLPIFILYTYTYCKQTSFINDF